MKEFILIFRLEKDDNVKPSPEQIEERKNWFKSLVDGNFLADKGNTLSISGGKTVRPGNIVEDAPYVSDNELVTGYVVVKAGTVDEAVELAKTNPIFKVGGNIEVREVAALITGK